MDVELNTAVTGGAPPAGVIATQSGDAAPAPGGATENVPTAQDAAGTAAPSPETVADSAQPQSQEPTLLEKVQALPRDQAFEEIKGGYTALETDHRTLKRQFEPWKDVVGKYDDPSHVSSRLELVDMLSTPLVVDGQVQYDPETKLPVTTAAPFIEKMEAESPGTLDRLFSDLCNQQIAGDSRFAHFFRHVLKLDPANIEKYQEFEKAGAAVAQPSGVTPDELAKIPEQYRETFRSLPPKFQEEMLDIPDEEARERWLAREHADYEANKTKLADSQREQAERLQKVETNAQESVGRIRSETYDAIRTQLASQWKPTADDAQNESQYRLAMLAPLVAVEPAFRFALEPILQAAGVQLDSQFDSDLATVQTKAEEVERLKFHGDQFGAQRAQGELSQARQRLTARLNEVAAGVMTLLDGRNAAVRESREQAIGGATPRPTINAGGGHTPPAPDQTVLPAHIKPGSREAHTYLWNQSKARAGQG